MVKEFMSAFQHESKGLICLQSFRKGRGSLLMKRNIEIDRLRAVAIILVVAMHSLYIFPSGVVYPVWTYGGWVGVELFFVISGFVVCNVLVPKLDIAFASTMKFERVKNTIQVLKRFFIRRIFRIFPLLCFWLMIFWIGANYFNSTLIWGTPGEFIPESKAALLFVYNYYVLNKNGGHYGQLWSLSVEEQFYIFLPLFLIIFWSKKWRISFAIFTIFFVSFALRPFLTDQTIIDSNPYWRYSIQFKADCLLAGCLLFFISKKQWYKNLLPKPLINPFFGLVVSASLIALLPRIPLLLTNTHVEAVPIINLICIALVYMASLEKNLILPIPGGMRLLDWIGTRSYGLYLVFTPAAYFTHELWSRVAERSHVKLSADYNLELGITYFLFLIVCTELGYRLIERPFVQKAHRMQHNDFSLNSQPLYNGLIIETQENP
jgi:peptidoglycan/LPS O-acetylase OafA/YrhL